MDAIAVTLEVGAGGNADPYLGIGWSAGEPGYRWMVEAISEVWLEHPDQDFDYVLEMELHPLVRPPDLPAQRLTVEVRGVEIARERLVSPGTFRWVIPKAVLVARGPIRVTFGHADAMRPAELGGSDDQRQLAISVHAIRLLPVGTAVGGAAAVATSPSTRHRRIVFVGNCQLQVLARLYRELSVRGADDEIRYVPSYQEATPPDRDAIANADIIVQQVLDLIPKIGDLPTKCEVMLVPHVAGPFLWPYTGQAHPKNRPEPGIDSGGPYPPDLGDSFLNRKIAAGVSAEQAVAEYMATDVAAIKRVDRLAEIVLDNQRKRDRACGFDFSKYIIDNFRSKDLFRSPNHPTGELAVKFITEVLERLDVSLEAIGRCLIGNSERLFPPSEMPIHASVAAHFGLTYAPPERRYRYFNEGGFAFQEFALRYMRYEWNEALAEGLNLLRLNQIDSAVAKLEAAVPRSPRAAYARIVLADQLEKFGRFEDAIRLATEAVALESEDERFSVRLAQISTSRVRAGQAV